MASINPAFIDVHFPDCDQFTYGCAPPSSLDLRLMRAGPSYEDMLGIINRDEWGDRVREIDDSDTGMDWLVAYILNQGQEGSCVGNMESQGLQVLDAAQNGVGNVIPLSAISAYKQIGSSPNSGAMVDDAMEAALATGVLPLDTPANRTKYGQHVMPATGFYSPWPSGWKATAASFRLMEKFIIRSVDGIISALLRGHPVGVGRAGHSILYLRPMFKNRNYGSLSSLLVKYVNSWGDWGDAGGIHKTGFGYDSMGLIEESGYWAFAFRSLVSGYGKPAVTAA